MSKEGLYPAFLSLEGKVCVVVGGGRVAARKVGVLLATGGRIIVISPMLHPTLQGFLAERLIDYIPGYYSPEQLVDATLVFAATNDPQVNLQVMQDAQKRKILVNVADNPDGSDFYVPATIQREDVTIAISTGGGAPAFARYVREWLEQVLSEAIGRTQGQE